MLTVERRQYILEILRRDRKVLASELSTALKVSEDTIRRDLRELAEAGLLQRVHGGALLRSPSATSYTARQKQVSAAKAEIAQAAVQLIQNGQVIILDGGTTTLQVARSLPPDLHATVITNSPPIVMELAAHPLIEAIAIGGQLHKESLVTVGVAAVEAIQTFRADLYMMGVFGLHPEVGISSSNLDEAHIKRVAIACAAEVVALVSSEKLGTAGPYVVAPLSELTHLVTERTTPEEKLTPYRDVRITVVQG